MASKKEVLEKIIAAVNEKTGGQKPCNLCGQVKWHLPDKFVVIPVGNDPAGIELGGPAMSLIPLVCTHCGNTHLLNLRILGFTDMAAIKIEDDGSPKT